MKSPQQEVTILTSRELCVLSSSVGLKSLYILLYYLNIYMQIHKICTCEYIFENTTQTDTHTHIFYLSTHWILSSLREGFCCVFLHISQHIDT